MAEGLGTFVEAVGGRVGQCDPLRLERAVACTLQALGSHLGGVPPALGDAIPAALQPEIERGEPHPRLGPAAFYLVLSNELGLRIGMALEIAQSTVTELAARLSGPARSQLRTLLPPAWAVFVQDPSPRAHGVHASASPQPGAGHSLATGRPGSTRPLADARPSSEHAESIASSDDPHGERLATAHGPGLRDPGRSLARGRPGSLHPLSRAG
ncbi:MAG: hypothetical protein KDK70_12375 [Myxococcales bacterium]|nr:hypothetical protein [Myxococcales bacterium]